MNKKILLTGATGTMGLATLEALVKQEFQDIVAFVYDTKRDRRIIKPYLSYKQVSVVYGDLTIYDDVCMAMKDVDIVLHMAAIVSPIADDKPEITMKVNYCSTVNIIKAIKAQVNQDKIRFVYISSVATTGDRLPPIHWGRIGDPIKPSYFDYYAVSKVAAERAVIESGLEYWVCLRQTGILSKKMLSIRDPIIFHNGLNNVLEYVTDYDSGLMMANCCKELDQEFWRHIYNVGGGKSCRMSSYQLFNELFSRLGYRNTEELLDSKWFATRNFHGQYYLDSDVLNDHLQFRTQDLNSFFDNYLNDYKFVVKLIKLVNRTSLGQKTFEYIVKVFIKRLLNRNRGIMFWINNDMEEYIQAYLISKPKWESMLPLSDNNSKKDWKCVTHIDHGYDESKSQSELNIEDIKKAAHFRGGALISKEMKTGDWRTPLLWKCAFGHSFEASPRLILEGGHWCPVCERDSWNYHVIARSNPFFAQVWYPLHEIDEPTLEVKKVISELSSLDK